MRALLIRISTLLALGAGVLQGLWRTVPPGAQEGSATGEGSRGGLSRPRRWLLQLAVLGLLLGTGGLLVAALGLVPIKASSGHWALTEWFLSFSMRRSIVTHTLGSQKHPPLEDISLVLRGAGHYETACRPCHGSPQLKHPRIAHAMTPPPPYLPDELHTWKPDQLFYIVKHGIKFTGMPGWPTQERDDEVWAMVAFLQRLPALDEEGYRQLVMGPVPSDGAQAPLQALLGPEGLPKGLLESCARCHGLQGEGRGPGAFPRLGGQRTEYLQASLEAYAQQERHSGIMGPIAAGLRPEELRALAQYYGRVSARAPGPASTLPPQELAQSIERGRRIATQGIAAQRVPSCADCHGPSSHPHNPHYPLLAGQYAEYLQLQLELFKHGHRGGSPYARLMRPVAERLSMEQMWDVARYYASLDTGLTEPGAPGPQGQEP
jgi:cytochrome c553